MKPIRNGEIQTKPLSRRRFLGGVLASTGALVLTSRAAIGHAGISPLETDIKGNGVPSGEVWLNNNENPLGTSMRVGQEVAAYLFNMNRFSVPVNLTRLIARTHGLSSDEAESSILVSPGSHLLLHTVAVIAAGDGTGEVIEGIPAYGNISGIFEDFRAEGAQTSVIRVPLTRTHTHDLEAMGAAVTPKTSLIVITNPNNPTGTLVPHEKLEKLVDTVPSRVMVLIDEAYTHFVREPGYKDAIRLALTRKNVIVTRTFSKVYGLAGMRVGYAVAHRDLIHKLRRIVKFDETLSILSQAAAAAALGDPEFAIRTLQVVIEEKENLYNELTHMGLSYTTSHANFVMIDLKRDARPVREALARRKIYVSRRPHEKNMANFMRVSIGMPEEMRVFITALKEIIS